MAPRPSVCFHNKTTCPYCGYPVRAAPRHKLRCPACGRFKTASAHHECGPCRSRGFRALRRPFGRRRRTAA